MELVERNNPANAPERDYAVDAPERDFRGDGSDAPQVVNVSDNPTSSNHRPHPGRADTKQRHSSDAPEPFIYTSSLKSHPIVPHDYDEKILRTDPEPKPKPAALFTLALSRKALIIIASAVLAVLIVAVGAGVGVSVSHRHAASKASVSGGDNGASPSPTTSGSSVSGTSAAPASAVSTAGSSSSGPQGSAPGAPGTKFAHHGIMEDTSIAAVTTLDGTRHVIFQDIGGSLRQMVYSASSKSWATGTNAIITGGARDHTPIAAAWDAAFDQVSEHARPIYTICSQLTSIDLPFLCQSR